MIIKKIKESSKEQERLLEFHYKSIRSEQLQLLRTLLLIAMGILSLLFLAGVLIPAFYGLEIVYMIALVGVLLTYLFFIKILSGKRALMGTYLFSTEIFLLTLYLSIIAGPYSMGVSIISLFCLMPVVIVDKSWRINLCMVAFWVIHSSLAFCFKQWDLAVEDTATDGCMMLIGILVGNHMRKIKLINYELRYLEEVKRYTDYLTGLYNRSKLMDRFHKAEKKKKRFIRMGVIMLDIDNFKSYNDTYGHQAGDEILRKIGLCLKKFGEEKGLEVYRYGGEEIIAITHLYDYKGLQKVSWEIVEVVKGLGIESAQSEFEVVTISAGFAESETNKTKDSNALMHMADMALYKAKANGRNQAVGYEEETHEPE